MATDKSGSSARVRYDVDGETPLFDQWKSRVDCGDDNILDNGVVNMLDVARGDILMLIVVEIVTAEGGTLTFDVGDGNDVDKFFVGIDGNVTAGTRYVAQPAEPYTAADTIDITMRDAADLAVIEMRAALWHIPIVTAA